MEPLPYINRIPITERKAFEQKVRSVADALGTHPNWLMQVMQAESGFDPSIENTEHPFKDGFATGLIQFTPSTARELKTTTEDLKKMSRVEQMDFVYRYLKPFTNRLRNYFGVYLVVFFPAGIPYTNDDNWVFETNRILRSSVARSNPAININKDDKITMGEFKQYLKNTVPKSMWQKVFEVGLNSPLVVVSTIVLSAVGFFF